MKKMYIIIVVLTHYFSLKIYENIYILNWNNKHGGRNLYKRIYIHLIIFFSFLSLYIFNTRHVPKKLIFTSFFFPSRIVCITDEQIQQYKQNGYLIVSNFLGKKEAQKAKEGFYQCFADPWYEANEQMKSPRNAVGGFGDNSKEKGILIFRKYTSIFLNLI